MESELLLLLLLLFSFIDNSGNANEDEDVNSCLFWWWWCCCCCCCCWVFIVNKSDGSVWAPNSWKDLCLFFLIHFLPFTSTVKRDSDLFERDVDDDVTEADVDDVDTADDDDDDEDEAGEDIWFLSVSCWLIFNKLESLVNDFK